MTTKAQATEQAQAIEELRPILERNHDVYAIVKHVSRSGMQRRIEFYVCECPTSLSENVYAGTPTMRSISHLVAKVYDNRLTDEGVVVNGCGMDMGWDTIYGVRRMCGLGQVQGNGVDPEEKFTLGYGFDIRYL